MKPTFENFAEALTRMGVKLTAEQKEATKKSYESFNGNYCEVEKLRQYLPPGFIETIKTLEEKNRLLKMQLKQAA